MNKKDVRYIELETKTIEDQFNGKNKVVIVKIGDFNMSEANQKALIICNTLIKGGFYAETDLERTKFSKMTTNVIVFNKKSIHNSKFRKKVRLFLNEKGIEKINENENINSKTITGGSWRPWFAKEFTELITRIDLIKDYLARIYQARAEYNDTKNEALINEPVSMEWMQNAYSEFLNEKIENLKRVNLKNPKNAHVKDSLKIVYRSLKLIQETILKEAEVRNLAKGHYNCGRLSEELLKLKKIYKSK
jgi:hypothetical protein